MSGKSLIYLINLDRDTDRLNHMANQLGQYDLEFERISAFLGLAIPDDLKPFFLKDDGMIDSAMNVGEVGCYASHLHACQKLLMQEKVDYACIMEDDLCLHSAFPELLTKIDELPRNWDIIRLSNPSKSAFFHQQKLGTVGQLIRYWRVPNSAGCYLISKSGARKFLTLMSTARKRALDEDLRRNWEWNMNTYGIVPPPVNANMLESSLEEIGGDRSLPGRKRFKDAKEDPYQEWSYRIREFGLSGCVRAIVTTWLFKKKIRKASQPHRPTSNWT